MQLLAKHSSFSGVSDRYDLPMSGFADEVIESHGVVLRALVEADVPAIAIACSDPLTQEWLPLPRPYTEESARQFVLEAAPQSAAGGDGLERAIDVAGEFVGVVGLRSTDWNAGKTEVGYWLGPWARGHGIMSRAVSAITDWALDTQGIDRVEAFAAVENHTSLATLRRALFIEEGIMRRAGRVHGGKVDLVVFSRLNDDPRPSF